MAIPGWESRPIATRRPRHRPTERAVEPEKPPRVQVACRSEGDRDAPYSLLESAKLSGVDPAVYLRAAVLGALEVPFRVVLPHEIDVPYAG